MERQNKGEKMWNENGLLSRFQGLKTDFGVAKKKKNLTSGTGFFIVAQHEDPRCHLPLFQEVEPFAPKFKKGLIIGKKCGQHLMQI